MAKRPNLTTEHSGQDAGQLSKLFKSWAEKSLADSIELLRARGLYARALSKIEQGQDISDELPELKTISTANAIRIIKNLIADADEQVESAWALDTRYADLFKTSFRMKQPPGELFPVFDVEYTATTIDGDVVISAVSNRRMVSVTVTGSDAAVQSLAKRLVIAGLG